MTRKAPTPSTLRKLFALSGNRCAFPGCLHPLVDSESNLVAEVCHIEAAELGGERYNENQTDDERRDFTNLIILCPNHHEATNNVDKYTVDVLKEMKRTHEQQFATSLYNVPNGVIELLVLEYSRQSYNNVNMGGGTQIVQIGLDYLQARQVFLDLFESNFPRLKAAAAAEAGRRIQEFIENFYSAAEGQLSEDDINGFQSPDLQFVLTQVMESAARHDSNTLREQLAALLVRRIKSDENSVETRVYNEAIATVGKLTTNQLKILTLSYLLSELVFRLQPTSWHDLEEYVETRVKPFLDFENRYADFRYLDYCGCCRLDSSFGPTSYAQVLKNRLAHLFPELGSRRDEQQYIEEEIGQHLSSGASLIYIWESTQLYAIDLTIVGIVIVDIFYGLFTGDNKSIELDDYFDTVENVEAALRYKHGHLTYHMP